VGPLLKGLPLLLLKGLPLLFGSLMEEIKHGQFARPELGVSLKGLAI
jgi:hypothetical protein